MLCGVSMDSPAHRLLFPHTWVHTCLLPLHIFSHFAPAPRLQCLCPELREVPSGTWFCHTCESEVQSSTLPHLPAATCVAAALSLPEGRKQLLSGAQYMQLLEGLRRCALQVQWKGQWDG